MQHQELIGKYGGKAASILAQYYAGNTDFLLPFTLVDVKEFDRGYRPNFTFNNDQIVRGSVSGDERGFVDVIDTLRYKTVEDLNEVKEKITTSYPNEHAVELILSGETQYFHDLEDEYYDAKSKGKDGLIDFLEIVRTKCEDMTKDRYHVNSSCIEDVIENSRRDELVEYALKKGYGNYSGIDSVIVQPENQFSDGDKSGIYNLKRGSIVEHPNIEGHYLINIVKERYSEKVDFGFKVEQVLADSNGNIVQENGSTSSEDVRAIVMMKKISRAAGFVDSKYASQVEFGFLDKNQDFESEKYDYKTNPTNRTLFYQEREFLQFDYDESVKPEDYVFNRFGKMLDKPLELRTIKMGEVEDNSVFEDDVPSVYVANDSFMQGFLPLSLTFDNMKAFVVPFGVTASGNSLEHNTYKWIQKADITIMTQLVNEKYMYDHFKNGEVIEIR